MKKVILFAGFLAISFWSVAQGNLQFSQVVRIKNTGTSALNTAYYALGSFTVPTGSVYKIESASVTLTSGTGISTISESSDLELLVDGQEVYFTAPEDGSYTFTDNKFLLPMWLGPGTYNIVLDFSATTGTGLNFNTVLSGLQFNVVQ